jgi:hypothetical protein
MCLEFVAVCECAACKYKNKVQPPMPRIKRARCGAVVAFHNLQQGLSVYMHRLIHQSRLPLFSLIKSIYQVIKNVYDKNNSA